MPTVTEPVYDIRTGEQTGTVTVTVESSAETQARVAAETAAVTNEATLRQQAKALFTDLRTDRDRPIGWTNAQRDAAAKRAAAALIMLGRLALREFDGTS